MLSAIIFLVSFAVMFTINETLSRRFNTLPPPSRRPDLGRDYYDVWMRASDAVIAFYRIPLPRRWRAANAAIAECATYLRLADSVHVR